MIIQRQPNSEAMNKSFNIALLVMRPSVIAILITTQSHNNPPVGAVCLAGVGWRMVPAQLSPPSDRLSTLLTSTEDEESVMEDQEVGLKGEDCKMEKGSNSEGSDEGQDVDNSHKQAFVDSFPILNALPPIKAKSLPSPVYLSAPPALLATHPFAPLTLHDQARSQPLVIIVQADQSVILHKQVL